MKQVLSKTLFGLILLVIMSLSMQNCQSASEGNDPGDLAGLKTELKSKKAELKEIEASIAELEAQIEVLEPKKESPKTLVSTKNVEKAPFTTKVQLQATLKGDDLVSASSEIGGRLLNFNLKEGQYVSRGQYIGKVDMETVNKQIAEIETALSLAQTTYERQERLWNQNIGSEIQYLQAKNNVERLEKNLETMNHQLSKSNIYSPASGVVDMKLVNSGEVIAPGQPIIQILNLSKIKVKADVPENYIGKIKMGDIVDVNIPAIGRETKGKVNLIGRSIDPANRTFKVEMDLDNKGNVLKPNLLASISFIDIDIDEAIAISTELVQQETNGQDFVYVVETDENNQFIAKKRLISTGVSSNDEILVDNGLSENDKIIVNGARLVKEGEEIEIIK